MTVVSPTCELVRSPTQGTVFQKSLSLVSDPLLKTISKNTHLHVRKFILDVARRVLWLNAVEVQAMKVFSFDDLVPDHQLVRWVLSRLILHHKVDKEQFSVPMEEL